jgi:hypothetical protein
MRRTWCPAWWPPWPHPHRRRPSCRGPVDDVHGRAGKTRHAAPPTARAPRASGCRGGAQAASQRVRGMCSAPLDSRGREEQVQPGRAAGPLRDGPPSGAAETGAGLTGLGVGDEACVAEGLGRAPSCAVQEAVGVPGAVGGGAGDFEGSGCCRGATWWRTWGQTAAGARIATASQKPARRGLACSGAGAFQRHVRLGRRLRLSRRLRAEGRHLARAGT